MVALPLENSFVPSSCVVGIIVYLAGTRYAARFFISSVVK